ncbi:Ig-like domain-containing protein [Methanobrevibacter olleyae]|uniref:Adhesin-like protein n=1 Tax=Methanobrevibacter olleyae TaxID=294671 RepID=A0A126QYE3_METOL|nr:Ig-like domain-containing protein [Methanobrevibacter olleyae]AMK15160.1 adhesin-like protein [Methanobrevibacter olleyae]SFL45876.1 Ig-like domain (group 3) [Methanobrevibacter olleyae]
MKISNNFINKILVLVLVLFLCLCCLNSVFAIDGAENKHISGYLNSNLPSTGSSNSLEIDNNENIRLVNQESNEKFYSKNKVEANNNLNDGECLISNVDSNSSVNSFGIDTQFVNSPSLVNDRSSVTTKSTKTKTKVVASNLNMNYYDGSKLVAYIKTSSNKPIKGLKITFKVNGKIYNRTSDSNGKVVLGVTKGITLYPGTYSCLVKFAGTSTYAASSKTVTITVKKWNTKLLANNLVCYYNDSVNLVATLQNSSSKSIKGKSISFLINGVTYSRTTDSSGKASLSLPKLNPGSYSCLVKFAGDRINTSSSKTVTVTVNKLDTNLVVLDSVIDYDNKLVVLLKDRYGDSISDKVVILEINNVNYNLTTNYEGIATFSLPILKPGDYYCSVKFLGDNIYLNSTERTQIKISKVDTNIIANNLVKNYGDNNLLYARLEDIKHKSLVNRSITFFIGNNSYSATTDNFGNVFLPINCSPGFYSTTIDFKGDDFYNGFNTTVNIIVNSPNVFSNRNDGIYHCENLLINLSTSSNNAIIYYSFDNGSIWYNGISSVNINLTEGNWSILYYSSLNNFNSSLHCSNFVVKSLKPNFYYEFSLSNSWPFYRQIMINTLNSSYFYESGAETPQEFCHYGSYFFIPLGYLGYQSETRFNGNYGDIYNFNPNCSGILLYVDSEDYIHFTYYDNADLNVNQFSVVYNYGGEYFYKKVSFLLNGIETMSIIFSGDFISSSWSNEIIRTVFSCNNSTIKKNEELNYGFESDSGFDLIHSFAIVNKPIDYGDIDYWLSKNSSFTVGGNKAAYGTFLSALSTIWFSDSLANEGSELFNVTWNRSTFLTLFSGISQIGRVFIHCPDASMGMDVIGKEDNIKFFNFYCSSYLSELETMSLRLSGASINKSGANVIDAILDGYGFVFDQKNNHVVITVPELENISLSFDSDSGIVREYIIENDFEYKGVLSNDDTFCFHDNLTNNLIYKLQSILGSELCSKSIHFGTIKTILSDLWNFTCYHSPGITEIGLSLGSLAIGFSSIPATLGGGILISIGTILTSEGKMIICFRNKFLSDDKWNYIGLHDVAFWEGRVIVIPKSPTHYDYIEVKYKQGTTELDRSSAIYIDGEKGKRNMTVEETYNYF